MKRGFAALGGVEQRRVAEFGKVKVAGLLSGLSPSGCLELGWDFIKILWGAAVF
jgi:hypothetical protein